MKGTKIKMREVEKKDYTFSNDEYDSIFVGICKSQELPNEYFDKDYELLSLGYIGSEFGVDFNINTYDEDFLVSVVNTKMSNNLDEIFANATTFDIDLLKNDYPDNLDRLYNTAIVIGGLKYEGEIKEIQNEEFGYFKFLGTYPAEE